MVSEAKPKLTELAEKMKMMEHSDFFEISAIVVPHPVVQMVFEAAAILLGDASTEWGDIKLTLKQEYAKRLFEFEKDNISADTIGKLKPLISNPDFNPEKASCVSSVASTVCTWVLTMVFYKELMGKVGPMQQEVASKSQLLKTCSEELSQARESNQKSE